MSKKFWVGMMIAVGAVIVLIFGFRLMRAIRHWGGPPHPRPMATTTDVELIRDWMTIPYIAHTYGVPDQMLFKSLEIPEKENRRKSLAEINTQYFPDQEGFAGTRIQEAIIEFQKHSPLPPPPDAPPKAPAIPTP